MSEPKVRVVDETGAAHVLGERIGRGGQGEVWRVEGAPRRIVKLIAHGRDREAIRRQLVFVRQLDLAGLSVARPLAVLRAPHVGYVAEFLDEMVGIGTLFDAPATAIERWYVETGGVRRRLRLLAHAGEALGGLVGKGVRYGDVSHRNVFVSKPVGAHEAWLIDLDNLGYYGDPGAAIFTPGYGAPEVVDGTGGCTAHSDAWAFAILAYQVLTLSHPFVGDLVSAGDPALEQEAFAGNLPWVECADDPQNRCTSGLPPGVVLGPKLLELARRTFEEGKRGPRPSVSEWLERLHIAADQTIACPPCGATYLASETACPWCDARRPGYVRVRIARWQPDHGVVDTGTKYGVFPLVDTLRLSRRVTECTSGPAGRAPHVELTRVERGIEVRTLDRRPVWVTSHPTDGICHEVTGAARTVPDAGWKILFESPDRPQRVALLEGRR